MGPWFQPFDAILQPNRQSIASLDDLTTFTIDEGLVITNPPYVEHGNRRDGHTNQPLKHSLGAQYGFVDGTRRRMSLH